MKGEKVKSFDPYDFAVELGGITTSGINWTLVTFQTEEIRQRFDKECKENGYGVRDFGLCQTQFHHYID
jgi:hypothetical protein